MKLKQKLVLLPLWVIALFITSIVPLLYLYKNLFQDIIDHRARINFGIAFILLILFVINMIVLRRKLRIKEQSISVAEELGIKPQTNFIVSRIIKSLDYTIPGTFFYFLMKGLSAIDVPPATIFRDILMYFGIGICVFLVHDYLKNHYIVINELERVNAEAELIATKLFEKTK